MKFIESRLLGVRIDDASHEALFSIVDTDGVHYTLTLHGVERLLVTELRQQNVIEELTHWQKEATGASFREAVFLLITGGFEQECDPQLALVAATHLDRVVRGELELMEITAIFGAQILASFASMTIRVNT